MKPSCAKRKQTTAPDSFIADKKQIIFNEKITINMRSYDWLRVYRDGAR